MSDTTKGFDKRLNISFSRSASAKECSGTGSLILCCVTTTALLAKFSACFGFDVNISNLLMTFTLVAIRRREEKRKETNQKIRTKGRERVCEREREEERRREKKKNNNNNNKL